MSRVIAREVLSDAIKALNKWHPNTPLLLVFSRQCPGPKGNVSGNLESVRNTYDNLFSLERIGIQDDARKYYLHFCHGLSGAKDYPYSIKKPTDNYGKTHQRIINDTFAGNKANSFLARISEGKYVLKDNSEALMLGYLGAQEPIDLLPLVLVHYWNAIDEAITIGDLWNKFCSTFGITKEPFDKVFTCSSLSDPISYSPEDESVDMRLLCLPDLYGTGAYDSDFWNRFRSILEDKLRGLKWQGRLGPLVSGITSALMNDQAVFLVGAPGTGKTTIATRAILPALRAAYGSENELCFSEFPLTPASTSADLFGFQGLDGSWINGPFVEVVMHPYALDTEAEEQDAENNIVDNATRISEDVPHLVFFDEANRVDIEALLSPIQPALDRMQARTPGGVVTLGRSQYTLPSRLWRVFSGNSPSIDIGRKEQSRPFKRRISVVIPPDPMADLLVSSSRFRSACIELLQRAADVPDVEVSEPALAFLGDLVTNSTRLEDLRMVLDSVRQLPQVAITVGLLESILLRAAAHKALRQDGPLDASLNQSLIGLITGDYSLVEQIVAMANERGFPQFSSSIQHDLISLDGANGGFGIEPLL